MMCAHGSSLLEEIQLADYQQQGLTEYEANQLCAQNNLGISIMLLMIPASPPMKLINVVLGTEFAKIGCDCALNVIKKDILPDHEWLKILSEFLPEGGVFLYCVLPVFNNLHPVDDVLRAKLRDGSVYYSGIRLTGYAISLISALLMAAYTATINYSPW